MNENPEIFLWKNGQKQGPISISALDCAVRMGGLTPDTPAWTHKEPEWKTAAAILIEHAECLRENTVTAAVPARVFAVPGRQVKVATKSPKWHIGVGLAAIFGLPLFLLFIHLKQRDIGTAAASHAEKPVTAVRIASSLADAEQCVLMVRTEDGGSASAFIAMDEEGLYIYTNVHAVSSKNVVFSDFRGNPVGVSKTAEVVSVAGLSGNDTGVDIVRFPVIEAPALALQFASRELIEQKPPVWALGDSGGQSILRSLSGRLKGVGPYKIEVDCEFIQGNSGGPIVTAEGKVVGIASYMTVDQSIWAKGTEQEIRRIGWIPGNPYSWWKTTAEGLAHERAIVDDCMITSDLLLVISQLEITGTGLQIPEDWPEEVIEFMSLVAAHPLRMGMEQTSRTVLATSGSGNTVKMTTLREYQRFFRSCAEYQRSGLESAKKTIKSAFWEREMQKNLEYHMETLENFKSHLRRFEETGGESRTLSDS